MAVSWDLGSWNGLSVLGDGAAPGIEADALKTTVEINSLKRMPDQAAYAWTLWIKNMSDSKKSVKPNSNNKDLYYLQLDLICVNSLHE